MKSKFFELGAAPPGCSSVQFGQFAYATLAEAQIKRFIDLIVKKNGKPPVGSRVAMKAFNNSYGQFFQAVVWFNPEYPRAVKYANKVSQNLPTSWNDDLPIAA